jgi:hypothetical protein
MLSDDDFCLAARAQLGLSVVQYTGKLEGESTLCMTCGARMHTLAEHAMTGLCPMGQRAHEEHRQRMAATLRMIARMAAPKNGTVAIESGKFEGKLQIKIDAAPPAPAPSDDDGCDVLIRRAAAESTVINVLVCEPKYALAGESAKIMTTVPPAAVQRLQRFRDTYQGIGQATAFAIDTFGTMSASAREVLLGLADMAASTVLIAEDAARVRRDFLERAYQAVAVASQRSKAARIRRWIQASGKQVEPQPGVKA